MKKCFTKITTSFNFVPLFGSNWVMIFLKTSFISSLMVFMRQLIDIIFVRFLNGTISFREITESSQTLFSLLYLYLVVYNDAKKLNQSDKNYIEFN